jgi:hypothetical protein
MLALSMARTKLTGRGTQLWEWARRWAGSEAPSQT